MEGLLLTAPTPSSFSGVGWSPMGENFSSSFHFLCLALSCNFKSSTFRSSTLLSTISYYNESLSAFFISESFKELFFSSLYPCIWGE